MSSEITPEEIKAASLVSAARRISWGAQMCVALTLIEECLAPGVEAVEAAPSEARRAVDDAREACARLALIMLSHSKRNAQ